MSQSTITRLFAVLTAVLVVCSFVAAPAAAVGDSERPLEFDGFSDSDDSSDDSNDEDETEETDSDDGDDTDEHSDDSGDSSDSDDPDANDSDADDNNTVDRLNDTVDQTTDTVEETVGETSDAVEDTVEGTTDTVDDTVEQTTGLDTSDAVEDTVTTISLETTLYETADRSLPEVPLDAESDRSMGSVPDTTSQVTTADNDFDLASADESQTEDDGSLAMSTGGGQPLPAGPASGASAALGLVAAAAALRGTPLLASFGVPKLGALSAGVSGLLGALRPFVFPLRYSRYDDSDPLEHEARERVYEIVNESPGAYLSELSDEADLPLSTTRHHIKVLEREDLVSGAKLRGKRRFYPAYAEGIELAAALNDDSTASIIDAIARIGAASVSDLADDLDRDPSTISHHLQRLEEDDIIKREREGRAVMNKLTSEARTALEPETTPRPGQASGAVAGGAD